MVSAVRVQGGEWRVMTRHPVTKWPLSRKRHLEHDCDRRKERIKAPQEFKGGAAHPPGGWGTGWQPQGAKRGLPHCGGCPALLQQHFGVPILALQRKTYDGNWASQVVAILSPALWCCEKDQKSVLTNHLPCYRKN